MYYPIIDKLKETVNSIKNDIIYQEFPTTQSWSSGTPGTRGAQSTLDIAKQGYNMIGLSISYISDSSVANVMAFMSNDVKHVYCNFYRADSSAHSDVQATVKVIYKKV